MHPDVQLYTLGDLSLFNLYREMVHVLYSRAYIIKHLCHTYLVEKFRSVMFNVALKETRYDSEFQYQV